MGIGDWGLGIGDWANPQSPIPNPQQYFLNFIIKNILLNNNKINLKLISFYIFIIF